MTDDAALATLCLPIAQGALALPAEGSVLFLQARADVPVPPAWRARLRCEQPFKPEADALQAAGFAFATDRDDGFAQAWVLMPRQRDYGRALLAQAARRVAPGGVLLASQANAEGARSGEADLRALLGEVASLSKHHCRAFWGTVTAATLETPTLRDWAALDVPRPVADGRFLSRPGLFAWDRIDAASALLVEHLPCRLAGRAADLGAGFGYLSVELLARNPGITALDLFEADARALDMARRNLADAAKRVAIGCHWHDVREGLPGRYDVIVSNPPFHLGRADLPELGRAFIAAAATALRPGGALWLVANRHLPYEATLAQQFASVRTVVERDGFKVIEAIKAER